MKETLQALYSIRNLALQKQENERNISQLYSQLQNKRNLKEMKNENYKRLFGTAKYIIIFVVLYRLLSDALTNVFTILINPKGFTLYTIEADPIYGMISAVPAALIITLVIRAIARAIVKKKARLDNQKTAKENEQILQSNADVDTSNQIIIKQISSYEQSQRQLAQELQDIAPWYPKPYFTISAVNYIIHQLENGKANSVKQAIIHYEAGQN